MFWLFGAAVSFIQHLSDSSHLLFRKGDAPAHPLMIRISVTDIVLRCITVPRNKVELLFPSRVIHTEDAYMLCDLKRDLFSLIVHFFKLLSIVVSTIPILLTLSFLLFFGFESVVVFYDIAIKQAFSAEAEAPSAAASYHQMIHHPDFKKFSCFFKALRRYSICS